MWLNSYFCFHRLHDCKHRDGKENCFNEALKSVYPEGVDTEMEQDLFKNILENSEPAYDQLCCHFEACCCDM